MAKMMNHRDPFWQDLLDARQSFDDMFNRFFSQPYKQLGNVSDSWTPPMDCYLDGNKFNIRLALPGVDPKQLNVQVHGNELTVSGDRTEKNEVARENYLQREFAYGHFERVIPLPEAVVADKIDAAYNDGVLHLTAPLSEKALPRSIEIKVLGDGSRNKSAAA